MACRDMDRAHKAAEEVRKRSGNGNVIIKQLDLASLQSVRHLADDLLATEERLDILINNAGEHFVAPRAPPRLSEFSVRHLCAF